MNARGRCACLTLVMSACSVIPTFPRPVRGHIAMVMGDSAAITIRRFEGGRARVVVMRASGAPVVLMTDSMALWNFADLATRNDSTRLRDGDAALFLSGRGAEYQLDASQPRQAITARFVGFKAPSLLAVLRGVRDTNAAPEPIPGYLTEQTASGVAGNPRPPYPRALYKARKQGLVLVQFLVDTMGMPSKVNILQSSDPAFSASVVSAVMSSRYNPATIGGHKVRQLVEEPFTFQIER